MIVGVMLVPALVLPMPAGYLLLFVLAGVERRQLDGREAGPGRVIRHAEASQPHGPLSPAHQEAGPGGEPG